MADENTPQISDDEREELQLLSRTELEQQIQRRTAELENLTDAMADILIKLDETGEISMVNGAVETILGYETATVEGKPLDFLLTTPPENHQSLVQSGADFINHLVDDGRVTDAEVYFSTREGDVVPMSLSASTLKDDQITTGIVCVAKDITERKEAEQRAEFLHSLLRHDLGNHLQVARGFLEALEGSDLSDTPQQHVEYALSGVEDAVELIDDVQTLNKIGREKSVQPVALDRPIREALDRHNALQERQEFDVITDLGDLTVMGGTLLTELFANLVENAFVHSNGSTVRLDVTATDEHVTVHVDDDGDGIPSEKREGIFERGVSHGSESGSGLGMYLVRELVDTYDGSIEVADSPLGGTRFVVTLQRATQQERG
ncbi:PAS domain S-box-containing protein [Halovenus aranensis]|uniref:histidine kinase n=1 Tax=Halovenus aranensis TaxID=890420 RepID=A0A1G8WKP5_9EURY|nr:PAS domain-containing sensor histidine kinase [Halovenus aranensis]SDJ78932.1 PAS domain S-box-containing protein [Halovenus aranensis]